MIKVGIAEDNTRLSQVPKGKVELNSSFTVKLIAEHGEDLVRQLKSDSNLDVVFMDVNMPKMDGIKATTKLTERWPHIKVLMLRIYDG
jgi:DNA-binding NarL/FixJ family response regulator